GGTGTARRKGRRRGGTRGRGGGRLRRGRGGRRGRVVAVGTLGLGRRREDDGAQGKHCRGHQGGERERGAPRGPHRDSFRWPLGPSPELLRRWKIDQLAATT